MIRTLSSRSLRTLLVATVLAAPSASAQKVMLQIRPHVGDTIRMHLTQTVEMRETASVRPGDSARTMTTSTDVFSRAVPFQWTSGGTLIQAITDSMTAGPAGSATPIAEVRRKAMPPRPAVMKVTPDGAMEVVDDGDANSEVRHLFAEMPAMLSRQPVAVGEKWSKEMRISLAGDPGGTGVVKAVLQLDSLSRNAEMAYISIRGTLSRLADARRGSSASYDPAGTFVGSLQIDRALGWITDARTVMSVKSRMRIFGSSSQRPAHPTQVDTRVTVWVRAIKAR
jgi:hypothetical protein